MGVRCSDVVKSSESDVSGRARPHETNLRNRERLRNCFRVWKAHMLTGDRKGTWSLSVTRNRRLTFRVDDAEREICDVNLEDYH
jgi:plasmid maintenance system killer protein